MSSRRYQQDDTNWQPWLPVIVALLCVTLLLLRQFEVVPMPWPVLTAFTGLGGVVTFFSTILQEHTRVSGGWTRVFIFRLLTWAAAGVWTTWLALAGWSITLAFAGVVGTVSLSVVGGFCRTPDRLDPRAKPVDGDEVDRRPAILREWENIIRTVSKLKVTVTHWEPWTEPKDGLRLFVELPIESGTTTADLAAHADKIGAARRLPRGCAVRVLDSDRQGVAVVDVMLRNTLVETSPVHQEPTEPASINDEFPVLTTPRGEVLTVCLRIFSMVIGGTTGSGKTTLLHRLIMWLARCVDAVIWVVDLNGGGLAEPWINPWANGRTDKPVVDWVADNEAEAAVMVAVALAIARDRKTNKDAVRRKKAANAMVLPVDKDMPAIVLLTDEGGEVRQAVSLLGQLAAAGITRVVQIGRAEAVRGIISILRGTSDLMDKAFRVNAALRICLRMEEMDEYGHVLGTSPGKTELSGALGAGYIKTPTIPRPVLGRTVNVDLRGIDAHAVACGHLRPDLDRRSLRVAAAVNASAVLGGREPDDELMQELALQHADMGMAYTGRWERYAAKLDEMRGVDIFSDDDDDEGFEYTDKPVPVPAAARQATAATTATVRRAAAADSVMDAWAASVDKLVPPKRVAIHPDTVDGGDAKVYQLHGGQKNAAPDADEMERARGQILGFISDARAAGRSATEIETNAPVTRSRVYVILREELTRGVLAKNTDGRYVLAAGEYEQAV